MPLMKGILFDNDGTLVDTHDLILSSLKYSTRTVLGRVIPDDKLMCKVGQPLAAQMADFTHDEAEFAELVRVYREHNHAHHDQEVRAFPGTAEALSQLQAQGMSLGVVTSKMHALAWRGLEISGLAPFLDCCIGCDDCPKFKPDPEPVVMGVQALGLQPGECIYVGDSPFDLQAGRAAGCKTIAVTWGIFTEEELAAEHPDFIAHTFAELVEQACSASSSSGMGEVS